MVPLQVMMSNELGDRVAQHVLPKKILCSRQLSWFAAYRRMILFSALAYRRAWSGALLLSAFARGRDLAL